ncbi:sensor histidine kinase [Actinomycetospora cinnamomea]|uniref:histidine kinase n=1 Tax=Actinomycetospora cinnamomea TaxID=663609 RepID=A0A2U1FID8_9PSEU|nr:sensor histidine kinase [Actinomycetospora cinnamomea]PVZ11953.1 signal transduction histidine kinase [Actinomycetospora cinnamomea]
MLSDEEWTRRHRLLLWVLGLHVPLLALVGLVAGFPLAAILLVDLGVGGVVLAASMIHHRRTASLLVTFGLTGCSVALVVLSQGSIEAHFHFFIIVGFLALYQDWFPFLWNIAFTVLSHGIGSAVAPNLIFNHLSGQGDPWLWSVIHGVSVLAACAGVLVFWRFTEDLQEQKTEVDRQLARAEISKKEFTSDLLLNLARRNQSMFHRQLDIINDLEEKERDPDVLAELFRLDHLATRVRRNAESLLVLSGEQPPRTWSAPVALRDVVRAAIAETEDLERITFAVDEGLAIVGSSVADLTHLLAELLENAVRYSPPSSAVSVQNRPYHPAPGAHLLIIEDTGVGMPADALARANRLLTEPQDVDVAASRQLGFHVVSRLAERHGITVSLTPTPGCGLTAVIVLPAELFPARIEASRPSVPSVLARPASEGVGPPNRATNAASATPGESPHEPARIDGRHAWPGDTPPPTPQVEPAPRVGAHELDPSGDTDGERTLEPTRAGQHGGLIRPIVVPPPREFDGDSTTVDGPAPAPRISPEGPGPHLNGNGDSNNGENGRGRAEPRRTLTRRVPQTHLAPELAKPVDPRPVPAAPAPSAAPLPEHPLLGSSRPAEEPGGPPLDPHATIESPLNALSRYQASRRMAHLEIGDVDPAPAGEPAEKGVSS